MKKIVYISLLGLLITSCGGDSKQLQLTKLLNQKNVATIKATRAEIQKQYDAIGAEL